MMGQTILHYKILDQLGEGGMGIVYKAQDLKLEREVAIKFLPRHIAINSEERERFKIEAKAAASLNHPNITTIHSIEEFNDEVFIVMEYIDGVELKDKIKRGDTGGLPVNEVINIAIQIAEGLEVAHKKGIVHRDIKSQNMMITSENKVKIMDFGLAKIGEGSQITKAGSTLGTVAYMSPEQTRGENVDQRSDIWSFGVVLYEMITGKLPFTGNYDQAIIYSILNQNPAAIKNISPELNAIIKKVLTKDLELRYQNIRDLINDLKQIKNGIYHGFYLINRWKKLLLPHRYNWKILLSVFTSLLLLVAYLYFKNFQKTNLISEKKVIAVLPFKNLGIAEDGYFADGITEEISVRLSLIQDLGIISHNSSMYYKNSDKTIEEISRELKVNYILNGSVRWEKSAGINRVKIIPRLTRISDNIQIWADSYERKLDEIFSLQGDIAAQIAGALNITLNKSEKKEIENELTNNFEAYQAYLRGSDSWYFFSNVTNFSYDRIELSIKFYKDAIALDPQFSQAWARLSEAYVASYWFGFKKTPEQLNLAKQTADKAIDLNPGTSESLAAMAVYYYWGLLDYEKALKFIQDAISNSPNDVKLIIFKALILRRMGDFKRAAEIIEKALPLDPQAARNYEELGLTYKLLREYDNAKINFNRSIQLAPDKFNAYVHLMQNYWLCCGELKEARKIADYIPAKTLEANNIHILFELDILERNYLKGLDFINYMNREIFEELKFYNPSSLLRGRLYQLIGNNDSANIEYTKARIILENKIIERPKDYRIRTSLGLTYAGLGLYSNAIEEGKKAVELYPLSKDALIGNIPILTLAYIYTMAGDYDEALDNIDELLSRPFEFSVALLKIDPRFDELRNHQRYKEIIEKHSK